MKIVTREVKNPNSGDVRWSCTIPSGDYSSLEMGEKVKVEFVRSDHAHGGPYGLPNIKNGTIVTVDTEEGKVLGVEIEGTGEIEKFGWGSPRGEKYIHML